MGTLKIYIVALDPASAFTPDQLSAADFGDVVARYRMEVGCGNQKVSVRFAVTAKPNRQGEDFVSAWPEHTRDYMSFLFQLEGDPLRSPVRWSRVLCSVVESVHRGIERVFPDEYCTHAEPGGSD